MEEEGHRQSPIRVSCLSAEARRSLPLSRVGRSGTILTRLGPEDSERGTVRGLELRR